MTVVVPLPEINCKSLDAPSIEAIWMFPAPAPVLITALPPSVSAPNVAFAFVVLTVPWTVVALAVLVSPPVKVTVSPTSPCRRRRRPASLRPCY